MSEIPSDLKYAATHEWARLEEDAPPRGMALLIKMLNHVRLEHAAEYGQLLSLFNQHAARRSSES